MLQLIWQDVRLAIRMLLKRPLFSIVCLVTLGCGVGVNTAMFSVVNAVLLKSLPFGDPGRLAVIWSTPLKTKADQNPNSVPNFQDLQAQNTVLEQFGAVRSQPMIFDDGHEPE